MYRPEPKQTPASMPDDWAIIWKTLAALGVFFFNSLFNLLAGSSGSLSFFFFAEGDSAHIWSLPKNTNLPAWALSTCSDSIEKLLSVGFGKYSKSSMRAARRLRQGYPPLPSKMAPLRADLSASWPHGAVCSSSFLFTSYCLHISSFLSLPVLPTIYSLHHFKFYFLSLFFSLPRLVFFFPACTFSPSVALSYAAVLPGLTLLIWVQYMWLKSEARCTAKPQAP